MSKNPPEPPENPFGETPRDDDPADAEPTNPFGVGPSEEQPANEPPAGEPAAEEPPASESAAEEPPSWRPKEWTPPTWEPSGGRRAAGDPGAELPTSPYGVQPPTPETPASQQPSAPQAEAVTGPVSDEPQSADQPPAAWSAGGEQGVPAEQPGAYSSGAPWPSYDQGQPPYEPPQPSTQFSTAPKQNTLAVVALITGILAIPCCSCLVFGIAATITGLSAKKQIRQSGGAEVGYGMAQAGFILGIVSVVLGVLANLAFMAGWIATPPAPTIDYSE